MEDFAVFLAAVVPEHQAFVEQMHDFLLNHNCQAKVENKASGYAVSYKYLPTKRVFANFVSRKTGLQMRLYGDNANNYLGLIDALPASMQKLIAKAPICKRLASAGDPKACNPKCNMGYDFVSQNQHWQKCKYNAFLFPLTAETKLYLKQFAELEMQAREALPA